MGSAANSLPRCWPRTFA